MSTISIPEHLWETLLPLIKLDVEPPELLDLLQEHIKPKVEDTSPEAPYDLIVGIAKWSQSEDGKKILEGENLDPKSYSLIPLLAGTTFAPSSKPPPPPPPQTDHSEDRRAITALINGLFSVVGVGFAAWWASGNVYWRNETRVLLALAASIVVAISEGVLYVIWSSHLEKRKQRRQKNLSSKPKLEAKTPDSEIDKKPEQPDGPQPSVLQRRGYEYQNEEDSNNL